MMLFPREYRDQATVLHKAAAVLALILITATVLGMVAVFVFRGFGLPLNVRRFMAITILGGAPAGLIIISIVNTSLSRRTRAHLLEAQSRKRGNALSSPAREAILKTMPYTQYDYQSVSKPFTIGGILIAIFIVLLTAGLYTAHPSPTVILFGVFMLLVVVAQISLAETILSKQREGAVALTSEGIQYTKGQTHGFMPWDRIREITCMKYGYSVRSDQAELMIWNEIGAVGMPKKVFQIGELDSKKLVDQIRAMNPNIVYVEPFLARKLNIPVSDRAVAKFIIAVIILFFILIIASLRTVFQ